MTRLAGAGVVQAEGLLAGDAVTQPADDAQRSRLPRPAVRVVGIEAEGRPDVDAAARRKIELLRHHADDSVRLRIELDRASDHALRSAEMPLPEGAAEDGVDRGIAAFVLCASLVRQYEFAQNVWINDPNFHELGNERDPIIGTQDGTFDMTIPKRPVRKKITGLPAFTTVRSGAYFFLPGIKALRYLATLSEGAR